MKSFPAVSIEGGLFAPDFLDQLLAEELHGQKPPDFGLAGRQRLTDEIAAAFTDAQALWQVFKSRIERLSDSDVGTSVTRDAWVIPFLSLLGFELHYNPRSYEVDGRRFLISHYDSKVEDKLPVHIVGIKQDLGKRAESGRPKVSPHALLQEYLNCTEALWGLVTNGKVMRLLRNSTYIRKQCYVEFNLEAIFEQHLFQDFAVLYRLLHRTRFPQAGAEAHQCLLERYYQLSIEQGGRVREHLRDGVEKCIKGLADGFLAHPKNEKLRCRVLLEAGSVECLTPEELYYQLLRLVYRFLFLLVSEDRGLISKSPLYLEHYSVSRLRKLVNAPSAYTEHDDLWHSLRVLWRLLLDDEAVQQIGGKPLATLLDLPVLDGELFTPLDFDACLISNKDLLGALWFLVNYKETESNSIRLVNYAALDVEELGSVYESLLEYHPRIDRASATPHFELAFGSERKSTGSYYTPAELVAELIRSALEPVIEERMRGAKSSGEREKALLSIKVVDPACGSGHFLLAAARRLGKELASVRTGEDEPAPEEAREAIRDVVSHCIYGVDKNPLAVELCRVALWLEAHTPGKPLTFLDHRIRCGDSLVGVFDLKVLKQGIPDEAFEPVSGDDRKLASSLKKRNKEEKAGQRTLLAMLDAAFDVTKALGAEARALDEIGDDSPEAIRKKEKLYREMQEKVKPNRTACDLWVAAFFQPKNSEAPQEVLVTTDVIKRFLESNIIHPQVCAQAEALAYEQRFFHWQLEFPEVFERGGFDVVLGNPPWERIKLQEQEFFFVRDLDIAGAPNAAARKKLIQHLPKSNPKLWLEYKSALHSAESVSRFLRGSGQYPLTGRGDINTYSVFAERMRNLLRRSGRAGVIVPTGIATDDTNKHFFADLVESGGLVSLYDFENREKIFPAVDSRYKFSLLTMMRGVAEDRAVKLAFFCTRAEHAHDHRRVITLSPEDISRMNPNTRTLPLFRTRQDAELTSAIYRRVPVLVNERTGENPWGVRFMAMFHMSNDSNLFRTKDELKNDGFTLVGNRFIKESHVWFPLYEAKMIWHYDHRYGTYEGVSSRLSTHLPTPDEARHADPAFVAQPWYWVAASEAESRLDDWKRGWLLGFRDITNATNERTAIFSLLPRVGVGNKIPLWLLKNGESIKLCALLVNSCSLVFDFIVRQKIGGTSMNFFYAKQLPVLPPDSYVLKDLLFIVPRVLELAYTAWDIKPFADDVWKEAKNDLREVIRAMWEENRSETGGNSWELPSWIEAYPEIETSGEKGIPFSPFKWSEHRRSRLRAELDTYYAKLYGLSRKQLRYILDPADLTEGELKDILDPQEEADDPLEAAGYAERCAQSEFPGETFRVLKGNEIGRYGEYRTRRLVLEAWERVNGGIL